MRFLKSCLLLTLLLLFGFSPVSAEETVTIGSKNFTEQYILGEILAQAIEQNTDLKVERRFNMGGTNFVFNAIRSGAIDIYPEYTGTGLMTLLKLKNPDDPSLVFPIVSSHFKKRYDLVWSKPFAFNNTYAVAVPANSERFKDVKTISDLQPLVSDMKIGMVHEYMDRPDGLPYLKKVYDLPLTVAKNAVAMDPGLMYPAVQERQVDAIVAYATDGRIKAFQLRTLKDDLSAHPPYQASALIRADVLREHPELKAVMERLGGLITDEEMIEMSYQVDSLGQRPAIVANNFLTDQGIIPERLRADGAEVSDNFFAFAWSKRVYLWRLLQEHIFLTVAALLISIVVALPTGIVLTRLPKLAPPVFAVVNLFQTIPSLALLGFLIPFLGIGLKPAVLALFLYALLPLVRNTYIGIQEVDAQLKEATRGLGLTDLQILTKVELPLALPTIMGGIRTSAVIVVGTATLAAFIGAGGLGDPIFRGISSVNTNTILLGAVPAALLAVILDYGLARLENRLVSKGLRRR